MTTEEDLIDKFLNERLSEPELVAFKEKWGSDPGFVSEVRMRASVKIGMQSYAQTHSSERQEKPRPIRRYFWPLGVAASVVLLVAAGLALWLQNIPSPSELALSHTNEYRLQGARTASGPGKQTPVEEAMHHHAHGRATEAVRLLKKGWTEDPANGEYPALLADLFLTTGQPDSALYYYQKVPAAFQTDSYIQWNVAMAHLHKGELEQANQVLLQLEGADRKKAQEVLDAMGSPGFRLKQWLHRSTP